MKAEIISQSVKTDDYTEMLCQIKAGELVVEVPYLQYLNGDQYWADSGELRLVIGVWSDYDRQRLAIVRCAQNSSIKRNASKTWLEWYDAPLKDVADGKIRDEDSEVLTSLKNALRRLSEIVYMSPDKSTLKKKDIVKVLDTVKEYL